MYMYTVCAAPPVIVGAWLMAGMLWLFCCFFLVAVFYCVIQIVFVLLTGFAQSPISPASRHNACKYMYMYVYLYIMTSL